MKVALLILTLNEIEAVTQVMPRVKREWVDEIIFVDGNSTDGTIDYIKEHNYGLLLEKKPGAREAMVEAINNMESDVVITFSPDGNCIPEVIPKLIKKMQEGYDMVIASRYAEGAKSYDDTRITAFGNWMFTTLINILYGAKYSDTMGVYRIFKKNLIKDLDLDKDITYTTPEKLFRTKLGWDPILSVRAAKRKLKVSYVPADEPLRIGGKPKLQVLKWGAGYLFQVIRERFLWR